eukprot:2185588-Prymnesium_polylepis.1
MKDETAAFRVEDKQHPQSNMKLSRSIAPGFCANTIEAEGDCLHGDKGSWPLNRSAASTWARSRETCSIFCDSCAQCRYFSYSLKAGDCSWFAECDLSALKQRPSSFRTERARLRLSRSTYRAGPELSPVQLLPTHKWITSLATPSFLMQVGANDHSDRYHNEEPGPLCVQQGWRAALIEPVPRLFDRLVARYASNSRVRCVNAAVAGHCDGDHVDFYSVDFTNATGNWGSDDADSRCADGVAGADWVAEISSLSRQYLAMCGEATARPAFELHAQPGSQECAKDLGALHGNATDPSSVAFAG